MIEIYNGVRVRIRYKWYRCTREIHDKKYRVYSHIDFDSRSTDIEVIDHGDTVKCYVAYGKSGKVLVEY